MIWYCLFGCAAEQEFALPEAEVFISELNMEGVLQISSYKGSTTRDPTCTTIYALTGVQSSCEDCSWESEFSLSLLSEACVFSDLEQLRFQVHDNRWMVLEQTGWEQWGDAEEIAVDVWSLSPSYVLLP